MELRVFSGAAQRRGLSLEFSLFDRGEERRPLEPEGDGWWALPLEDLSPGTRYGLRLGGGPLLLDPAAEAVVPSAHPEAPGGLLCAAPDRRFEWGDDAPLRRPWRETVIYEAHVKGMTARCPWLDPELRGTYLGLADGRVVDHLLSLGVTAVELMPVAAFLTEPRLRELGLPNYWGYNPAAFLAPHPAYATRPEDPAAAPRELKTLIRTLHRAGLEVILDVVFNHTAEGPRAGPFAGPTLSLRGLDEGAYYRLDPDTETGNVDWTGCGNTLDASSAPVQHLILSALRHWVREYHVDGFRFDLAPTLGRGPAAEPAFDPAHPLLSAIARDPVLASVKLIAEPWDLGPDGYCLGRFPPPWAEWNDRFRDAARAFWRGDRERAPELRRRLAGSPDLGFHLDPDNDGASHPSLDFITCHDGFTLEDLVSYGEKHNQANLEDNRDGHPHNLSRNWGVEGPTDDPEILAARDRAARGLLTTLALTQGVPMLSHGDEFGRTQAGNNNAYCHDSELTWVDWEPSPNHCERLLSLRRRMALGRRRP